MNVRAKLMCVVTAAVVIGLSVGNLYAGTLVVTDVDSWFVARDGTAGATTLTDANTNSPKAGDATAGSDNADNASLGGTWGSTISLAEGETLNLSGTVTFTDSTFTDAAWRVGLYDDDGNQSGASDGGITIIAQDSNVGIANSGASFHEGRTDGFWMSTGGNSDDFDSSVQETAPSGSWTSGTTYDWSLSIVRTGVTSATTTFNVTGGGGFSTDASGSDSTHVLASDFDNIDTVGILFANSTNLDFAELGNIQISVVPEPSSLLLLIGCFSLLLMGRRRRS